MGTNAAVAARLRELTGRDCDVASNPEFLKEGAAIDDFMKPDRVVVGTTTRRSATCCRDLYQPYLRTDKPFLGMSPESAEMTKYVANALLATKISFINEMANLCERAGADINDVRRGIGHDSRIGFAFLFPGVGYGGSCFPRTCGRWPRSPGRTASSPAMLDAVHDGERVPEDRAAREDTNSISAASSAGSTIGVWGLAFKPSTDDIREAPALVLIERLLGPRREAAGLRPRGDGKRPRAVRRPAGLL